MTNYFTLIRLDAGSTRIVLAKRKKKSQSEKVFPKVKADFLT